MQVALLDVQSRHLMDRIQDESFWLLCPAFADKLVLREAVGLAIRVTITPGQWGDLLEGLKGVGQVMADAAYDADHLRRFITHDLGASPQIKANPSRSTVPSIGWALYKERHLVGCFFNRIKRFRRIALRCEKTLSSFKAFVTLACAMAWLA